MDFDFINGFVKRAQVYGIGGDQAMNLLDKLAAKKMPSVGSRGDLNKLYPGSMVDFVLHAHQGKHSGSHNDLRIGNPDTGLYSWATRKELPKPGDKPTLLYQQNIHCFPENTLVHTSRGVLKISDIVNQKLPISVLSVTGRGGLVYRRVVQFWKRKTRGEKLVRLMVNIPIKRIGYIYCSCGHEIYSGGVKRRAGDLAVGDRVDCLVPSFTPDQKQLLYGMFLGDGSVSKKGCFRFGHTTPQKEYFDFLFSKLSPLFKKCVVSPGHGSLGPNSFLSAYSNCLPFFERMYRNYVQDRRKVITKEFANKLSPLALAIWYQDDGSITNSGGFIQGCSFATHPFDLPSISCLQNRLSDFNIASYVVHRGISTQGHIKWELRLNKTESLKFFKLIAPFVHPSLSYKIGNGYTQPLTRKCRYCTSLIRGKSQICDTCFLDHMSKYKNFTKYLRAYDSGLEDIGTPTIYLRVDKFSDIKKGNVRKTAGSISLTYPVGSDIHTIDTSARYEIAGYPIKWKKQDISTKSEYLYDLGVEDTHNYFVGTGFLVGNSFNFKDFQGDLKTRWGEGKMQIKNQGKVLVVARGTNHLKFISGHRGKAEQFTLVKTKNGDAKGSWLAFNTTPKHGTK